MVHNYFYFHFFKAKTLEGVYFSGLLLGLVRSRLDFVGVSYGLALDRLQLLALISWLDGWQPISNHKTEVEQVLGM